MKKFIFEIIFIIAGCFLTESINSGYMDTGMTYEKWAQIGKEIQVNKEVQRICATIKHIESGGNYYLYGASGEIGAYQWMIKTWMTLCNRYVGRYLEPIPENQEFIAYNEIKSLVNAGYSVKQIASIWNCGSPSWYKHIGVNPWGVTYDTPSYVKMFYSYYLSLNEIN
ncbi:MAG: hypothetical protein PHX80_04855 [Candidatus Nanoarchaeia archaeon]|nr:hypothetical protein [Candidatus Nanoarchaeia archaeon]